MKDKGNITRAATQIGALTLLSRVLGYVRDATIAFVFGAGLHADTFFVAFRVSNLLRRLVGEGAMTTSFVPIYTEELKRRSRPEASVLASRVFTLFFIILVILAALGILFSEELVRLMAPGFDETPGKFALTVSLTRFMFPYMVFIGLMAIAMGVLNSLKHFTAPAFSPVLLNLSIILSAVLIAPMLDEPVYALAIGVLVGGALQFALQVPFMKAHGISVRPDFEFRDPAIKGIFALMGPAALGVGVYQLNLFVTMRFASGLAEGSVSYLYYASRLMELPLGVFAVAVATAVLPDLSESAAAEDWHSFRGSLALAAKMVNFVTIPATVGLIVLSAPIIDLLFTRGEFGPQAARETAFALYFYSIGLVPVAVSRIFVSVFYSVKDTTTPVFAALGSFFVNIVMCYLLVGPLGHGGLALALSISAVFSCAVLLIAARRKFGPMGGSTIVRSALKSAAASLIMGLVLFLALGYVGWDGYGVLVKLFLVFAYIAAGVGMYWGVCALLNVPELSFLKGIIQQKLSGDEPKKPSN